MTPEQRTDRAKKASDAATRALTPAERAARARKAAFAMHAKKRMETRETSRDQATREFESSITCQLLREIGNPLCPKRARESLDWLAQSASKKIPKSTDPDTPITRTLWSADKLSTIQVRSKAEANALTSFAKNANKHRLDPSQISAVKGAATAQLSMIWGAPGTGKTDTLLALLHAVIRERKQRKILLTGPNCRTIEELAARLWLNIACDPAATCNFYCVYPSNREPKMPPSAAAHVDLRSFRINSLEAQYMVQSMANASRTTIIATTAHAVNQVIDLVGSTDSRIDQIFDLVVLDEGSQIPVTLALRPLCALRDNGQLVIAGDPSQVQIQSLGPPTGADYLVSSIQTYLTNRFALSRHELLVNYRSNQDLVEHAKTLGYSPKLRAFNAKKDLYLLNSLDDALAKLPPDIPSTDAYKHLLEPRKRVAALIHDNPISPQAAEVEAGLVAGLAFCARHCMARELDIGGASGRTEFDDDSFFDFGIGIVTPHKAQKALVIRALFRLFPDADAQKVFDSVDTIERFQGQQRQTIIVWDGIDADVIEGEEAFRLQVERINVAVRVRWRSVSS